jgi:hypothetical protein
VQVTALSDLWTTDYGGILAAKLTAVAALLILAAVNRYRLTPLVTARSAEGARALRRSIVAELVLVLLVFGLVATWRFTPPPRSLSAAAETAAAAQDFFTHLHGPGIAANVTVSPGQIGPLAIVVELLTEQLEPLEAAELTVTLANEAAGIEPIARQATRLEDRTWQAVGFVLPVAGTWSIAIAARVSTFDQRNVAGAIAIRDPNAAAPAEPLVAAADGDHEHATGPNIDLTDPLQVIAIDGPNAPTIAMAVADAGGGFWDLQFTLGNFRFGAADDGVQHIDGVGHAHVFVNGQYVAQLDAPSYRLELPAEGVFECRRPQLADHRALSSTEAAAARIVLGVSDRTPIAAERQVADVPMLSTATP